MVKSRLVRSLGRQNRARQVLYLALVLASCMRKGTPTGTSGDGVWAGGRPQIKAPPPPPDFETGLRGTIESDANDTGAGKTTARFSVGTDGSSAVQVPLEVPAGVLGMQPELSLVYNSQGTETTMGPGWSLHGLSSITGCPRTAVRDGATAAEVFIREGDGLRPDTLCLDGRRLVAVDATHTVFQTDPDTFVRVRITSVDAFGIAAFEVRSKDGRISIYGDTDASRVQDFRSPPYQRLLARHAWLLSRVQDRFANRIDINYTNQSAGTPPEILPTSIAYVGAVGQRRIDLHYIDNPAVEARRVYSVSGLTLQRMKVLSTIKMSAPDPISPAIVRTYTLDYQVSPNFKALLHAIRECDGDAEPPPAPLPPSTHCKRPTTFDYETTGTTWTGVPTRIMDVRTPGFDRFWTLIPLDVNGDGRTDLLYRRGASWVYRLSKPTPVKSATATFGEPVPLGISELDTQDPVDIVPFDFDRDGRSDLAAVLRDNHGDRRYEYFRSDGTKFVRLDKDRDEPERSKSVTTTATLIGDISGDAIPEVLRPLQGKGWGVRHIDDDGDLGNFHALRKALFDPLKDGKVVAWNSYLTDTDGDGRLELLARAPSGTRDVTEAAGDIGDLSAADIATANNNVDQHLFAFNQTDSTNRKVLTRRLNLPTSTPGRTTRRYVFADVTGDGLTDAIELVAGDAVPSLRRNVGGDFDNPVKLVDLGGRGNEFNVRIGPNWEDSDDSGIRVMDANMDGRQDLLLVDNGVARDGQHPGSPTRARVVALIAGQDGFHPQELDIPIGDPANGSESPRAPVFNYKLSQVGDFNGDGLPDLAQVIHGELTVFVHDGNPPNALIGMTDGMGLHTSITYDPITNAAVYTPGTCAPDGPRTCVTAGQWVVSEYQVDNGAGSKNTYRYTYRDGLFDRLGGGFLGFAQRTFIDPQRATTVTETFDNRTQEMAGSPVIPVYKSIGLPTEIDVVTDLGGGARRTRTTMRHYDLVTSVSSYYTRPRDEDYKEEEVLPSPPPLPPRTALIQHRTTAFDYNAGEIPFGNLHARTVTYLDTGGAPLRTDTTTTEFDDFPAPQNWLISLLNRSIETSTVHGTTVSRTASYTHDVSTGFLTQTRLEPDSGDADIKLTISYTPDPAGRVADTIATGSGKSRSTHVDFDPVGGVYPFVITERVTAPDGMTRADLVSRTYIHPALGVAGLFVDPSGAQLVHRFDGFGRIRRELLPGGGGTTTTYAQASQGGTPERFTLAVETSRDGGGVQATTFNLLGQEIRRQGLVFSPSGSAASRNSFIEEAYDPLGRRASVSRPAFEGTPETSLLRTTFTYDNLDRVIRVERPDESSTSPDGTVEATAGHAGLGSTFTDEVGNTRAVFSNLIGLVDRIEQTGPNGTITTRYDYGPFGRLEHVRRASADGALATTTTALYDNLDRRTSFTDEDGRTTQSFYNAFGEQRKEVDANNKATLLDDRDELGRLRSKISDVDGTTRYVWDANGPGRLASVTSPDGTILDLDYDEFGRLEKQTWTIDGSSVGLPAQVLAVGQSYDAAGRLSKISYPESFVVRRDYSSDTGELQRVVNDSTNSVYWELKERRADGQLAHETLGDGRMESLRRYVDQTGRLSGIDTNRLAGGTTPASLRTVNYTYQSNGSLISQTVQHAERPIQREGFRYDPLDRLHSWFQASADGTPLTNGWAVAFMYDDFGSLVSRILSAAAGPQTVTYSHDGQRNGGVHGVTHVSAGVPGEIDDDLGYDAKGDQVERPGGERVLYTAFELPKQVTVAEDVVASLLYDGLEGRAAKFTEDGFTFYAGDVYEKRVRGSVTGHVFYVSGPERTVAQVVRMGASDTGPPPDRTFFLHPDRLGNVEMVTDDQGVVVDTTALDPYGNRITDLSRPALPTTPRLTPGDPTSSGVRRGFTEQEHDGDLGYINMRGRIYDSRLAQFLSPDPVVGNPFDAQAYNRYAYARGNPGKFVDPTGFQATTPAPCNPAAPDCQPPPPECPPGTPACITTSRGTDGSGAGTVIAIGAVAVVGTVAVTTGLVSDVAHFFGGLFHHGGGGSNPNGQSSPPPPTNAPILPTPSNGVAGTNGTAVPGTGAQGGNYVTIPGIGQVPAGRVTACNGCDGFGGWHTDANGVLRDDNGNLVIPIMAPTEVYRGAITGVAMGIVKLGRWLGFLPPPAIGGGTGSALEVARRLAQQLPGSCKVFGECFEFADQLQAQLQKLGVQGTRIVIETTRFVFSDKFGALGAQGSSHVGIRVGEVVFDNLRPGGVPYTEFIQDLGGALLRSSPVHRLVEIPF